MGVVYCRVLDGHPGLIKNEELRINSWGAVMFIENWWTKVGESGGK